MALLLTEGFDNYGATSTTIEDTMAVKYDSVDTTLTTDDATGRFSGNALRITFGKTNGMFLHDIGTTNTTLICGFALWVDEADSSDVGLIRFENASAEKITLALEATTSKLKVIVGTSNIATCATRIKSLCWNYIEWKFTVGSNSPCEIKINGVTDYSGNVDTQDGSATYYNLIRLYPKFFGPSVQFDDLYICDGSTSNNNDFLGECKIETIYPESDNSCDFANLSTGTDHYALVDDKPLNLAPAADYVYTDEPHNLDLLDYGSLSDIDSVLALTIWTTANIEANTAMTHYISSNGSTVNSGNITTPTGNVKTQHYFSLTDPDTSSAWTPSGVDAAIFGYEGFA